MTKAILKGLVLSLLIPVFSCQNNEFTFTGKIEGMQDGDSVFINRFTNTEWEMYDTLIVKNSEFSMTGKADSCEILSYWIRNNNGSYFQGFFFSEPGKITLNADDEKSVIGGTPLNDLYQQISDSLDGFSKRFSELGGFGDMPKELAQAEDQAELARKSEALQQEVKAYLQKQITENADNQVGLFLTLTNANLFAPEEMEQLIASLPEKTRNNPAIKSISATIEQLKKNAVGQPYTDFEMRTPEGNPIKISDIVSKNKITVLDFWASWCGPCMAEAPEMVRLYQKVHALGVEFIGVSLDTDEKAWKKAIADKGLAWPQGSELKEWQHNNGAKLYSVDGIPFTIVLSQEGTILAKGLRAEQLEDFIEATLSKK